MPCPACVTDFHAPGGLGVRLDSALYAGYSIPPYYDSLIAKLIVHGRDREEALIAPAAVRWRRWWSAASTTTIPLYPGPSLTQGDIERRRLPHPLAGTVAEVDRGQ